MTAADIIEQVKSGVLNINFVNTNNEIFAKGTGFMCKGLFVTNHHVFLGHTNSRVWIRAHNMSENDLSQGLLLNSSDFSSTLKTGSEEANYDFAVLDIPQLRNWGLYNFELHNPSSSRIGDDICFLGYPFEHMNLTSHRGSISSFYVSNGADIIQIDASVNVNNSGGPLINSDGNVIGVISRKATGLTKAMDQLEATVQKNIQIVQNIRRSGVRAQVAGIDSNAALEASQVQMLDVIKEIRRSANVGIGYAVSSKHLLDDNVFN